MDRSALLLKIRRDIDRRNKTDMKLYPWMVFAVLTLYTFVAFYRGLFFDDDLEIRSFSIVVVGSGLVLAIMYVMATRVNKHNKRDAALMTDVCDLLDDIVTEESDRAYIGKMRDQIPETAKQSVLFILFFATLFPAAFGALIYALGLGPDPDNLALNLIMVSFVLGLIIILININFPRVHEKRFIRFSDTAVDLFASLGVAVKGYGRVIGGRNIYFLVLLSIVTLGVFIVVWLCISMWDFNRHIDEQWNFEDNVLEAMKLLVLRGPGFGLPSPDGQMQDS